MSKFLYEFYSPEEWRDNRWINFNPEDGVMSVAGPDDGESAIIPKTEAINLASKLLQWGTSS